MGKNNGSRSRSQKNSRQGSLFPQRFLKKTKRLKQMKLTMKEPYPDKPLFSRRVRGYVDLVRPFTLLAPVIVSVFIMTASLAYSKNVPGGFDEWWKIIANASGTLAIVNAASNALNQACDYKADKISKPYRPIPRGVVSPAEAQSFAYILYFFALLRSVMINVWFGVFVFLIMVFTVTYSLPPRMKQYLFINQIWISIPRGLLGILAAWSVFGLPLQPQPLAIGLVATVFLIGGMTTKDFVDSDADKKTGVRTLVNTFGRVKSAAVSLPFMFFPFAVVPLLISMGVLSSYMWWITLFVFPSFVVFYLMMDVSESGKLENVHAWSMMYVEYFFFAIVFAVLVVFGEFGMI